MREGNGVGRGCLYFCIKSRQNWPFENKAHHCSWEGAERNADALFRALRALSAEATCTVRASNAAVAFLTRVWGRGRKEGKRGFRCSARGTCALITVPHVGPRLWVKACGP
ncbi:hypothetical protein GGTG_13485 [Gaeumannomyces tritici R3-111a-1]|uniref:Uncharacterized protein n=1 Tax=Gaeumannomyces tritici (strain R3-111a-1) TaxID=644352 RepID=J3PJ03_GAET3|nr:hypothetical protein GGTG_13485 [Gaeumannomyces tritici R3-111a-1]EJT68979.1 hypothetical protein GGTG_13485 [Gaeumannomyces tritici R3-111a-1]